MPTKKIAFTFLIGADQKVKLEEVAKSEGRGQGEILREAFTEWQQARVRGV